VDTLILGVGNPLMGDDAIGILAIERLREYTLPNSVDLVDGGTDGIGLIPVIEQYRRVILVDAVPMGLPAGSIRRMTWQDIRLVEHEHALSLHQSDLTDALLLAETLGCLPSELILYGVQPLHIAWDLPLSEVVAQALPVVVNALINEVGV
jgi:hydrogenase maturation protease